MTMLRCVWGRECGTQEDNRECRDGAVGIVAVRDGTKIHKLVVCEVHRNALVAETAPV